MPPLRADERLTRIGDLDLDDEELELLLQELQATMVHRSPKHLAARGRQGAATESVDDGRASTSTTPRSTTRCSAVTPSCGQYLQRSRGSGLHARSRLQIVLSAITNSFGELLEPAHAGATAAAVAALAEEGDKGVQDGRLTRSDEDEIEVASAAVEPSDADQRAPQELHQAVRRRTVIHGVPRLRGPGGRREQLRHLPSPSGAVSMSASGSTPTP